MENLRSPESLLLAIEGLRTSVLSDAEELFCAWRPAIERADYGASAHNLACYLALRRHELRALQLDLARYGLSSLGRSESRVHASLDALVASLRAICGLDPGARPVYPDEARFSHGTRVIACAADALFGDVRRQRATRIMVTLPTQAGQEPAVLRELVQAGVDCVRINCAHDSVAIWSGMLENLRVAERELALPNRVKVLMDLAGPKVRTLRPKKSREDMVRVGDELLLTTKEAMKRLRKRGRQHERSQALVGCTLPEALERLAVGASVQIDDGKLGARVVERVAGGVRLEVTQAPAKGAKIRADKGLNFPDSEFAVASLTDKDRDDLRFVAEHADMIGYSFVQTGADIAALREELARHLPGARNGPGLVLKIETQRAVRNLPELIVHAAGQLPTAVMIARGDLAIELGFRRIAEVQEEILWLCEAANVPVIWATQVLEGMAKNGLPTRAEVTDAAMASRAECVMLNKGPHIVDAIRMLDDVLVRMEAHQHKKTAQLRVLQSWEAEFSARDSRS